MKIPSDMKPGTVHGTNHCGDVVIVAYGNNRNVTVKFASTGVIVTTLTGSIRTGKVKDYMVPSVRGVGFIGVGSEKSRVNGSQTKVYKAWTNMLDRCYDAKYQIRFPTYIGCTVCKEWHNFQNYAKWHHENMKDGDQLDKDIKIPGNKVYSPTACLAVSPQENMEAACAKSYEFYSPTGDLVQVYNLKKFCSSNGLNPSNMCKVNSGERNQHKGWTKVNL